MKENKQPPINMSIKNTEYQILHLYLLARQKPPIIENVVITADDIISNTTI